MGMRENWKLFIKTTKNKGKGHGKSAQYWDTVGMMLSLLLIFLGSVTTFMALVKVPTTIVAGLAAVGTMLSALQAFLKPADRRQLQSMAAREFQELMLKMVRCEEESEYEELWRDLNKAIVGAPFLSKKFRDDVEIEWTMTPELENHITEKEGPIAEIEASSFDGSTSTPQSINNITEEKNLGNDNFGYGSIGANELLIDNSRDINGEKVELLTHKC